jgi:hypothetical protein
VRKKAENKIRRAVSQLQTSEFHRIDQVREKAGIIRKVFDKTILDMARVGTIELADGDIRGLTAAEIGNLISHGDQLHVYFKFLDNESELETEPFEIQEPETSILKSNKPGRVEPERPEIILLEIAPEIWQQFEKYCEDREGKNPLEKIIEMIQDYNQTEKGTL